MICDIDPPHDSNATIYPPHARGMAWFCLTVLVWRSRLSKRDNNEKKVIALFSLGSEFRDKDSAYTPVRQHADFLRYQLLSGSQIKTTFFLKNSLSLSLGLGTEIGRMQSSEFGSSSPAFRFRADINHVYLGYFAEDEGSRISLNFGQFPYATHSDASLFGEYLFRYGASRPSRTSTLPLGDLG